ncbi:putative cysteine proteinase [Lyophyllum shimeji]|uniref:Ubiquitin carboxyl-terminal hydrolase n=1 Tax=Lyophyllum shimeji TaxID=47721 RepID=A0A9P3UIR0_LYOSH|nr:putative cysteine proteinase [Lyophyllum shimeji]
MYGAALVPFGNAIRAEVKHELVVDAHPSFSGGARGLQRVERVVFAPTQTGRGLLRSCAADKVAKSWVGITCSCLPGHESTMAQPPGPSSSTTHFATYSYAYPNGQTPLSPLPKQLFMPPPGPPPHAHHFGTQSASSHLPPPPHTHQQSQSAQPKSVPRPGGEWAIWSRRPQDPAHAPGIIISPNAKPPPDIVQQALDLPTPPPSPQPAPTSIPASEPAPSSTVPSSSVTETTTDRDTPAAGSPVSSATSLSASASASIDLAPKSAETTPVPAPAAPASAKKSWASLLQSPASSSVAVPSHKRLLPSAVVGISVPAHSELQNQPPPPQPQFAHPALTLPHAKRTELLTLLTSPPTIDLAAAPAIRPRGLVNTGNMCFANSVLQVLVYCPPFLRLFTELGRFGFGIREEKSPAPLVDAMVEFVREFSMAPKKRKGMTKGKGTGKGKGKERAEEAEEDEEDEGVSFLPSYVYDAMKEKTVFDGMRSGQQEDAEEFLGFFLDALEEELLAVVNALSPQPPKKPKAKSKQHKDAGAGAGTGVEEKEVEEETEDGWLEVGKRNRMVVTRTIKAAETPLTRIFGGKVRSTLKAPGQKDSVTVEAWRALRLDIQHDAIHTLPEALAHMAVPQPLDAQRSMQHLLDALPPVLVVHLKRFLYDKDVGGVVKIGKVVRWGEGVEVGGDVMAPALRRAPPARYRLFGVVYHHGQSAAGGHYTLDVLHPARAAAEGWMRVDDELVSDLRPADVFGSQERQEDEGKAAYLLFYQRVR